MPTTEVVNLGQVFGDDKTTRQFAERYFRVQHTDLLFANAAIFVEGVAERMLLPLFIERDFATLNSRYLSFLDIGGSHVLKALTYTHRGKIDVIYIDPPYNTGAKDWKYNNDYVEKDDSYRHSKWLAMIERRLLVAKELLNPVSSVMLITIDEKEYLRLGLLLEQLFPEATIQMISTVIAPQGSQRPGRFSRIEEYVFCVFFGQGAAIPTGDAMIATTDDSESKDGEAVEGKVTWTAFE